MLEARKPRIVVTIHGIQTDGEWQKRITPHLARHGMVPYHLHYGWFSVVRLLLPFTRNRQIQKVRDELRQLVHDAKVHRVSVIAHSFGTMLAIEALVRENGDLRYDRIVLSGSIIPRDFGWATVMSQRKWAVAVRNERADQDFVVRLAAFAAKWFKWVFWLNAGDSGRLPFNDKLPSLIDACVVGGHSETHNVTKFERWARFVSYPYLPDDLSKKVHAEMQAFRQEAAVLLGEPPQRIRVNLFAPIDGALRIVPGATDNMTFAPEFDLEIEPDHGGTGTAFSSGNACIVVKQGNSWTGNTLPGDQLAKIHPSLRWVVSLPVKSEARDAIVGVLNVDGLDNVPGLLQDSASVDCQAAMLALHGGMLKRFSPSLEAAFRGEELPRIEA